MIIERLSKKSQENIAILFDRIRSKQCCVFVGAGLSSKANYPLWKELLDTLKKESEIKLGRKIDDEHLDYSDKAEEYRDILGVDNYLDVICQEFNPENDKQPWLPVHVYLVEMPFVSYISTNYDCLIENAFSYKKLNPVYSYYPKLPISRIRERQIYHIHGVIDHLNLETTRGSIILTRSDFDEAYKSGSDLSRLLTCLYTELTILFIGFNINDPYMKMILQNIKLNYEQTKKISYIRGTGPLKDIKHYALLQYHQSIDDNNNGNKVLSRKIDEASTLGEDEKLQSLGVHTIRYIADGSNHTQLIYLIQEINSMINGVSEIPISQDLTFRGV